MRWIKNLSSGRWLVRRRFPKAVLANIEQTIAAGESCHRGELRFAVEAGLPPHSLWRGDTPRDRAVHLFSQLGIWDTEENTGVLVYLLLAERRIEIVADRGIHAKVGEARWSAICRAMEAHFRADRFEQGVLEGLAAISALLQTHFPAGNDTNPNELPNAPLVL